MALVDAGTIRVIDILILTKNDDGSVEAMELSDLEDLGPLQQIEAELAELLAEEDVAHLPRRWTPAASPACSSGRTSGRRPFASAARRAGGQLIANGRIPIQAIIASIDADEAPTTKETDMPLRPARVGRVGSSVTRSRRPRSSRRPSRPGPSPVAKTAVVRRRDPGRVAAGASSQPGRERLRLERVELGLADRAVVEELLGVGDLRQEMYQRVTSTGRWSWAAFMSSMAAT